MHTPSQEVFPFLYFPNNLYYIQNNNLIFYAQQFQNTTPEIQLNKGDVLMTKDGTTSGQLIRRAGICSDFQKIETLIFWR